MARFTLDGETYELEVLGTLTLGDFRIAKAIFGAAKEDLEKLKKLEANDPDALVMTMACTILRKHPDRSIPSILARLNSFDLNTIEADEPEEPASPLEPASV
jgi:hypothetical protein